MTEFCLNFTIIFEAVLRVLVACTTVLSGVCLIGICLINIFYKKRKERKRETD